METQTRKYLYSHTSQETAYVVDDYPWGFRLRTKIRYWIESKDSKNGGQRFVSQTINPKTGEWCAPKKSTYSPIMVMFLDEKEHIHFTSLDMNSPEKYINEFKSIHLDNLTEFQKKSLKEIIAFEKVMRNVTFTFKPVPFFSDQAERERELDERKKSSEESLNNINKALSHEIMKVVL